jgi:hypothetical protein
MVPADHSVSLVARLWRGHFAGWSINESFDTAKQCEAARTLLIATATAETKKLPSDAAELGTDGKPLFRELDSLCIATDDPRLKGN